MIYVKWVARLGKYTPIETDYGSFLAPRIPSADTPPSRGRTASGSKGPSGSRSAGPQAQSVDPRLGRQARSPARRVTQKRTVEEPDTDAAPDEEADEEEPGRILRTYAEGEPNGLLTIYHHSYRGAAIVGWSGTKRDGLRLAAPEEVTGYGGSAFLCPACGQPNASGLLLCLHCFAIYYYSDGADSAVSPIAHKAYELSVAEAKDQFEAEEEQESTGPRAAGIGSRSEPVAQKGKTAGFGSRSEPVAQKGKTAGIGSRSEPVAPKGKVMGDRTSFRTPSLSRSRKRGDGSGRARRRKRRSRDCFHGLSSTCPHADDQLPFLARLHVAQQL